MPRDAVSRTANVDSEMVWSRGSSAATSEMFGAINFAYKSRSKKSSPVLEASGTLTIIVSSRALLTFLDVSTRSSGTLCDEFKQTYA